MASEKGVETYCFRSRREAARDRRDCMKKKKKKEKKKTESSARETSWPGQDLDAREENARKGNHVMLALTALQAYPVV
jgi:hypothetical protein